METTIQVKSAVLSANKEWYNIKDVNGKEYSVALKEKKTGADKNPALKEAIEAAQTLPYPLTGELTDWQGKLFLNDYKPKKQWNGKDKDEPFIAAQTCLKSACELNSGTGASMDLVLKEADKAFTWVMSKKSK